MNINELTRLAFIYAENDQSTFAQCCGNTPEGESAKQLANAFRTYRLKRWGKTKLESIIEDSKLVPINEFKKL